MTYELWLLQGTPVTSLSMNGSQVTHDSRDPSRFVDPFDPWSMTHWSILGSAASTTHFYSEIWWRRHGTVCKLTSLVRVTTMKTLLISTVIRIVCLSKWTIPFLANVNSFSRSLYVIACSSVCGLSVCRLSSATFVRPIQAVQIFGNISAALGTMAIRWHPL